MPRAASPLSTGTCVVHRSSRAHSALRCGSDSGGMETLERLARGCYVRSAADLPERCAAALVQAGDDTVVVGPAAAALHRLWLPREVTAPVLARVAVSRRSAAINPMRRPGLPVHRWQITPDQLTVVAGLPVTTMERTWWDLAAELTLPDLVAAGDRALQLGADHSQLSALVRQKTRRRGNANARIALALLDPRSESRPESHLRVITRLLGLDCFQANEPIVDQTGGWLARPDLSCRHSRIALEYQGKDHANLNRMRQDITRDTDLRRENWRVLYYGPTQVFDRPHQIGPELVALHGSRSSAHHE